jgi:hypothetical protein
VTSAGLYLPLPQLARYRNAVLRPLVGYAALAIFLWILLGERTPSDTPLKPARSL